MGVCSEERGQERQVFGDKPGKRVGAICLVQQQFGKANASGRAEEAQRIGFT